MVQVQVVTEKDTGNKFALKTVNKEMLDPCQVKELKNEAHLLSSLEHPSIVRLHRVYEKDDEVHLVMQLLSDVDLGRVKFKTEKQVAVVMKRICQAIDYCHKQGICHRDIKPGNFVFAEEGNFEDIVLIDFGLSHRFKSEEGRKKSKQPMKSICGTPYFVSPQQLQRCYSEACDYWALGVLAYLLLTDKFPFEGESRRQLFQRIGRGKYHMPENLSHEAQEFLKNLIQPNPKLRWSCKEALASEFIQKNCEEDSGNFSEEYSADEREETKERAERGSSTETSTSSARS